MSRTMQQTGNEAFTQDLAPVIDDSAGWTAVCRADDLVPDGGICVLVRAAGKAEQIAIFSVAGELYAVSNRDPIGGAAVLSRGITGNIGEHVVVASPLYKQHYDLRTGRCLEDAAICLAIWPVRQSGDAIQLQLA